MENLNCKELITKIKMDYARKLLQGSEYAIGDIAIRCGYDNFAYYSKVYKLCYLVRNYNFCIISLMTFIRDGSNMIL